MARFDEFQAMMADRFDAGRMAHASDVQAGIPIYAGAKLPDLAADVDRRAALLAEWADVLADGPGVLAITDAIPDASIIDRANKIFDAIITQERASGAGAGDHFAKPGANDRIWNSLQKHCLADPQNFADYYAAPGLALAARAWLGPNYQVTAQVNRVNPGGRAQRPHRDYHLGFMPVDAAAEYPAHIHRLSPGLTLQGAIAHCDMPVETGPTMVLPYSQRHLWGYLDFGGEEYQDYFAQHHAQLPLNKGDMLFFNPALMHGAGNNDTGDVLRLVNLFQISSAFGRAMEAVDRDAMVAALYPVLKNGSLSEAQIANVIAASAEGYAFPTNLDNDPPIGGLAPKSQAERMASALDAGWDQDAFLAAERAAFAKKSPAL